MPRSFPAADSRASGSRRAPPRSRSLGVFPCRRLASERGRALGLGLAWPPRLALRPRAGHAAGTGLVISEVYGAGGNAGADLNADFVEIYNPTGAADLARGKSRPVPLRDGSAARPLTRARAARSPAGEHYLVPDEHRRHRRRRCRRPTHQPGHPMAASGGQVLAGHRHHARDHRPPATIAGTTRPSSTWSATAARATTFEGAGTGPTLTATTSAAQRRGRRHRRQRRRLRRGAAPTPVAAACCDAAAAGEPTRPSPRSRAPTPPVAARRRHRHHPGRRHRGVPDRWLQRLLHPDRGHRRRQRRHPRRLRRGVRLRRPAPAAGDPADRRLRRGDRHRSREFAGHHRAHPGAGGVERDRRPGARRP